MKQHFFKNKTEYIIGFVTLLAWAILAYVGFLLKQQTYPIGYWQKPAFGLFSTVIGFTAMWFWMEKSMPSFKRLLDPDNSSELKNKLTTWQQVIVALVFISLFILSFVFLTALY